MMIELATPAEYTKSLEAIGSAILAALTQVLEARITSLELVTQAQHRKIEELTEELGTFTKGLDDEIDSRIENALEELEVTCEISTGNSRKRYR